jgi:dTDP-4-dehydrorhamnose reductase
MTQKVVVVGAGGQLGRELVRTAPVAVECVALTRSELDVADPRAVTAALAELAPGVVINAAAYTAVDAAESEPEAAHLANVEGPTNLARACSSLGDVGLIHVSTDFVFDGKASRPYGTDALPAPLGEYGQSKLAGELAVRGILPGALVIRTGWVYSRFGSNFVKTMLRLMAGRSELGVVADQVGTPTWARGLAEVTWAAVARPRLDDIYHWSDAGVCSWYDFAVAIHEEAHAIGLLERPVRISPITTADYPTAARRPAYSVLDKTSAWRDLGMEALHWRVQLRAMLAELKE